MVVDPVPVSFEVYPAPDPARAGETWQLVRTLAAARPDFISVTSGAPGAAHTGSRALLRRIAAETSVRPAAHLTCVGRTRAELVAAVTELLDDGVRQFVALWGDVPAAPRSEPGPGGLRSTSELVALIREVAAAHRPDPLAQPPGPDADRTRGVTVAVAAHPAVPGRDPEADLTGLARKEQAGADLALTQFFFEAEAYHTLVTGARERGVGLPVVPGILPMTEPDRLARLARRSGVPVPDWVRTMLAEPDPGERLRRGTLATVRLVREVLDLGAPGVHVYTLNRSRPALEVLRQVRRAPTPGRRES